jgi:transposase
VRPGIAARMLQKKECLLKLIDQPPSVFGINRTSWRLEDLSSVYKKEYGMPFSRSSVSTYIDKVGFSFKKQRKFLQAQILYIVRNCRK